ncbi:SusF/SusE family outer membrane protein [Aquiflexum sp. TKW24L]|uniref:SusF/SusE family outer membrane protein n=1 Tax=Aquiflexum sp. TKW24L TaxID=2942212 RepID=UPI0020BED882|nr:SusF/SusE family outer membrane protein [Aquiflexum sp. TKW24L]MCL6259803.1 SusF/SusE family outer membrane protein [Aquiflexum sp. TKW24L]
MKVLSKLVWVAFILPLILWSCSPVDDPAIIPQTPSTLTSPTAGSAIVLKEADKADTLFFQASIPDFGVPGNYTYALEMARGGTNFATVVGLGSSTTPTVKVAIGELNKQLVTAGLDPEVAGNVDFRFKTTIDRSLSPLVGAGTTLSITPYKDAVILKNLFIVGNAAPPGWNNDNNNPPLFRDPANKDLYVYTGFFAVGEFKVLEKLGQWQPQWGKNGDSGIGVSVGATEPPAWVISAAGHYVFTLNLATKTFTLVPFTGAADVYFPTVGIIGSSTPGGWDNSTAMTNINFDKHLWYTTATVTNGEIKFRANNAWTINWGAKTPISGRAELGSPDNVPIVAGTYKMWFNSLDGRYIFIGG